MDAEQWDYRYVQSELVWGIKPNQFVAAQIEVAGLAAGRALDLACGEGRNSIWLASLGWDVKGIDFSGVAIEKAAKLAAKDGIEVDFEVGDVLACDLDSAQYDLVLLAYVQLAPDQRKVLVARSIEALAPGGVILVVAHDLTNLEDGYGGPQAPEMLWALDESIEQLQGLDIEVGEIARREVATEDGPRVALDTLIRARKQ